MWKDPIVEEVRAIRDAYARQFDYKIDAIYDDLKKQESRSTLEFVSFPPKRIKPDMRKGPPAMGVGPR